MIDEAQDMNEEEFGLINALIEQNEEMRVIAVGDDDQNIFEFRGADSKYLKDFITTNNAVKHELIENYRSKNNLVEFTNQFVSQISHRLKKEPIRAVQPENGKIKIVHYQNNNLITPLVNDILSTDLTGTTCVLTRTNDEALQITGLLLKNKMQAKLIQSNDGFSLYNLLEIRYFLDLLNLDEGVYVINDEVWTNAKKELKSKFQNSSKYDICENLITDFEKTNPKYKYKSDLEIFIRESKLEDFMNYNGDTIFVSTIHKAKGKEFDNVFLMLENYSTHTDENKRLLYVAMTRAKRNLTLHTNSNFFNNITVNNLELINNKEIHLPPKELAMLLSLKDVWLDYFINRQIHISKLTSGDTLILKEFECTDQHNNSILKFSQQFTKQIENLKEKNYNLKSAKVNFILYWKKEDAKKETKIVLPELHFERITC